MSTNEGGANITAVDEIVAPVLLIIAPAVAGIETEESTDAPAGKRGAFSLDLLPGCRRTGPKARAADQAFVVKGHGYIE